jgi:hypothetical protein
MAKIFPVQITYELVFTQGNPVEIKIEADTSVECHIKAILHANTHYPHWQGIKEVKKYLTNDSAI